MKTIIYGIDVKRDSLGHWATLGPNDSIEEARKAACDWIAANVEDESYAADLAVTAKTLEVGDELPVDECEGIDGPHHLRLVKQEL